MEMEGQRRAQAPIYIASIYNLCQDYAAYKKRNARPIFIERAPCRDSQLRESSVVYRRLVGVLDGPANARAPEREARLVVEPPLSRRERKRRSVMRHRNELHDGTGAGAPDTLEVGELGVVQPLDQSREVADDKQVCGLQMVVPPQLDDAARNAMLRQQRLVDHGRTAPLAVRVVHRILGELIRAKRGEAVVHRRNALHVRATAVAQQEIQEVAVESAIIPARHQFREGVRNERTPLDLAGHVFEKAKLAGVHLTLLGQVHLPDLVPVEVVVHEASFAIRNLLVVPDGHPAAGAAGELVDQQTTRPHDGGTILGAHDFRVPKGGKARIPVNRERLGKNTPAAEPDIRGVQVSRRATRQFSERVLRRCRAAFRGEQKRRHSRRPPEQEVATVH